MSLKWTGSETGILRKSEYKEKKEELFVFGYSCKLFREDDKALLIDQGKHLIPWMGDESLKIDRYDARGALHELTAHEAPPGGYDWRVELTKSEYEVEQLCDEERYRALHTNEDEEEMYKEEELKRLHAAGYGQVGFNYTEPVPEPALPQVTEVDEPFVPTPAFSALLPDSTVFPETQKQNAIIEKTAKFIADQGAQMEILIKAKQRDNPQFKFLNKDDVLNPYYTALIALVKTGKWPERKAEVVEEKPHEHDEYLHPSLASTVIESAPSIPSIQYKPSADCDYTLLICKMRGSPPEELPPPGTEPAAPHHRPHSDPLHHPHISRPPVMYNTQTPAPQPEPAVYQQYATYYRPPASLAPPRPPTDPHLKSTGLSLMKNYASGSDTDGSDYETEAQEETAIPIPPTEIQLVIEKMAAYVARNGDEFAEIVRAKNDPRFIFLEPDNVYHPYYMRLMQNKRGVNGTDKMNKAPVSFSIKKQKEPDPILPKPALPYESSSEDDESTDKQEKTETRQDKPETTQEIDNNQQQTIEIEPQIYEVKPEKVERKEEVPEKPIYTINNLPPVVVYKMEGQLTHNLPTITTAIIPPKFAIPTSDTKELKQLPTEKIEVTKEVLAQDKFETKMSPPKEKERDRDSPNRREKKRHKVKKDYKEYYKSERDGRHTKSSERDRDRKKDRERQDEKERESKRRKSDNMENEIINLEENSDELIDLTGDLSDSRGELDTEVDKAKQVERRRRAAEFLKKVGVDPTAVTLPTNSLASAMVDTLETIRKKKAAEEEKRRRREKRKRRDRRDYGDDSEKTHRKSKRRKHRSSEEEGSDDDGKKKKRKKDKKPSKTKKKKPEPEPVVEEPTIDISNTLKELRTNSPTESLMMNELRSMSPRSEDQKKKREYSEGEWSSDSDDDSLSSCSKDE